MMRFTKITLAVLVFLLVFTGIYATGVQEDTGSGDMDSDPMPFKGQTLTVSMWGYNMDLLEKNIITPFEEKYGVTVVTETGNNSDRFTKMVARKANPLVDVALFAGSWSYKAIEEGIIQPYNPTLIPNLDKIMDTARDPLGGNYAVGYTIQHLGLFYRTDKVAPISSWKDLSRDDLKGLLSIPTITTTYGPPLVHMLSKAWSGDFDNTEAGWDKIEELAPSLVTAYSRSSELNTLIAQEEVYAAPYSSFAWGNIVKTGLPVKSVIPEEGLIGSFSMISIAAGTGNEELAHLYIDHLLSYDVQMAEAMDLVDSPVRTDIELPPEIASNLTYGEELIGNLHFFSHKKLAEVQENDRNCHFYFMTILGQKIGFLPQSTEYCQPIDCVYSTFC
ncbi:MAG: ABC transporter substrate-binding protein [Spirochaetales bacterium]|nr:ABC transporter substrate-binding protein [Spirochaetales bacterium]